MNKKALYESIMRNVAKQVKKALNEGEVLEFESPDAIVRKAEKDPRFTYQPQDSDELRDLVKCAIDYMGPICDLNWIDTSRIDDMRGLFAYSEFDGDISGWDVSNVVDMDSMFAYSKFNGDISEWDVRQVKYTRDMFKCCRIREEYKPEF